MVERPDWNLSEAAATTTAVIPSPARPDWSLPAPADVTVSADDRAAAMDPATGLPAEFVRELSRKPDGLERSLDYLRDAINLRFGDDRDEVIGYFEEMSPGLQAIALNVFLHNPGASWDDLVAKVRRKTTLAQAAELSAWLNKAVE